LIVTEHLRPGKTSLIGDWQEVNFPKPGEMESCFALQGSFPKNIMIFVNEGVGNRHFFQPITGVFLVMAKKS